MPKIGRVKQQKNEHSSTNQLLPSPVSNARKDASAPNKAAAARRKARKEASSRDIVASREGCVAHKGEIAVSFSVKYCVTSENYA